MIVALLWEVCLAADRARPASATAPRRALVPADGYDPGRERRAEQRARELLRSCVNDEEWAMYRDLGFIRVWGTLADGPGRGGPRDRGGAPYAYLVYPHKPIVAYLPADAASCSTSTASSSPTRRGPTAARACPTPTTCSPSGWR